jgi:hypothetical protein
VQHAPPERWYPLPDFTAQHSHVHNRGNHKSRSVLAPPLAYTSLIAPSKDRRILPCVLLIPFLWELGSQSVDVRWVTLRPERLREKGKLGEQKSASRAGGMNIVLLQCSSNINPRLKRWAQQSCYYCPKDLTLQQRCLLEDIGCWERPHVNL